MKRKRGAPFGNKNASHRHGQKPFTNAINKALKRYSNEDEDPKKRVKAGEALDRIGIRLVEMATIGDREDFKIAMREISDRIEGKPVAAVQVTGGLALSEMDTSDLVTLYNDLAIASNLTDDSDEDGSSPSPSAED